MSKEKKKFDLELFFRALADRTRLRLLNLMRQDEICVCFFVDVIGTNQPKISRHLAYLRRAGIVTARRDGKWMHYKIVKPANECAANILENLLDAFAKDKEMQAEREELINACCTALAPVQLQVAKKAEAIYLID
ncbi:MAG: metalloregulator ArsR/SmtB family transcription factor [Blastocatellia bacterium]|nr:metalloregulator ArsR/SmtB family transcription factor [Blastocatellia bacterium]MBL8193031.1 metalloregulator ArsR/SmtB family transcription factor [Blastocatellia bacterium]MBN8723703.1 metalloregulator ArsR/SmtB family transcription factor [Acidobacteriota bacterium]